MASTPAPQFVKTADNPTVYMVDGGSIRAVNSPQEFASLTNGGDMNSLVQTVPNLDNYNRSLNPNDPSLKLTGLTDAEKQSYIDKANSYYQPTKDAFGQLITGQLGQEDLGYDATKSRIEQGTIASEKGLSQDLANRGFLRSGEQVVKSQRFVEDQNRNIQQADLQRQINRANILLNQLGFNAGIDKQAMADANTAQTNEFDTRKSNVDFARSNYANDVSNQQSEKTRLAGAFSDASALDQAKVKAANDAATRDIQRQMLQEQLQEAQINLQKAKLSSGSGSGGADLASLIALLQGSGVIPTGTTNPSKLTPQQISDIINQSLTQGQIPVANAPINGVGQITVPGKATQGSSPILQGSLPYLQGNTFKLQG